MNDPGEPNRTRLRIVAGARAHFLAHGFRGVTMDALAEEIGLTKKTLYVYFPGKIALVEAVLKAKFDEIESDFAGIMAEHAADCLGGLSEFLACRQRHFAEIHPAFFRDVQLESSSLFKTMTARRRDIVLRIWGKLFKEGVRAGVIRSDLPDHIAIEILLGALEAIVRPDKLAELGLTPNAAATAIMSTVIEGILTGNGRKKWKTHQSRRVTSRK